MLACHFAALGTFASPPHMMANAEASVAVADLVNELVERAMWAVPPPVAIRASTHKQVGAVTRNADSLPHAMAVVRALRGHKNLDRRQLRQLASSFFRLPYFRYSDWPKESRSLLQRAYKPTGAMADRMTALFPLHTKPPFVQQLLRSRPADEFGNKLPVTDLYEYGMDRAYQQMQAKRRERKLADLRWLEDAKQWWPAHRDQYKAPKGVKYGQRLPEFLEWYAEQSEDPRNFLTLYDLEAMVWRLPEKPSLILYYREAGKVKAMTMGPPPLGGAMPYELMWSGDDSMQFVPIVPTDDLARANALSKEFGPQHRCRDLVGPDMFRTNVLRNHVARAEEALRDAGFDVTPERLADELGVSPETAAAMQTQIECEDHKDVDDDRERALFKGAKERKRQRTAHLAVSLKFRSIVDGRRKTVYHRVAYVPGKDEAPLRRPFEKAGLEPRAFKECLETLQTRLGRRALVGELASELSMDTETTRAMLLEHLEENPGHSVDGFV